MVNIIAIDPSLISTGLMVNNKLFNYCRESDSYNKSGLKKWYKISEELVTYRMIEYRSFKDYSEGELIKLKDYDSITDMIIDDILDNINPNVESYVGIEGFSFGSTAGDLIDLVAFSTLLRKKIFDKVTENITVLAPSTLKQETCKMVYKPIDVGVKKPKLEYRNNEGISGGKFTKREMYQSIIESEIWNDEWAKHLNIIKDDVFEGKTIKKPHEDLNDAYLIYKYIDLKFNI